MSTYRVDRQWGVAAVIREGTQPPAADGRRPDDQLAALIDPGAPEGLAERIRALLNADERCWHGEHCDGSGPECERDAPLKGGHRDCAAAWHANHGCATEPYDGVAPSAPLSQPVSAEQPPGVAESTPDPSKATQRSWGEHPAHPTCIDVTPIDRLPGSEWVCGPGCPRRCICNDPPPTTTGKNTPATRPPGWACPRHGEVI